MTERLALLYSDGSMGVLGEGATIEQARKEREFVDKGARRADLTKIGRITIDVITVVDDPAAPAPASAAACPTCGRPHAAAPGKKVQT